MGDIVSYVRHRWGLRQDPIKEAERLIAEAKRLYAEATQSSADTFVENSMRRSMDDTMHQHLVNAGAERAHPMIQGADLTPTPVPVRTDEPKRLL
jgi:hypothetical protein